MPARSATVLTWRAGDSRPTTLTTDALTYSQPYVSGDRIVMLGGGTHIQVFSAVLVPSFTSLTIKTSASSSRVGKQFILSGLCFPSPALVGRPMHVDVKKPGKSYWSYSSNRTIYAGYGGEASWQYKYTLKSGMPKGTYQFRAVYAADASYANGMSVTVSVVVH